MHLIADPELPKCPECGGKLFLIIDNREETVLCRDCGEEWESDQDMRSYICCHIPKSVV
jgi:DNA-directed RNA polymerase subunit RPC12/RpoP